MMNGIGYGGGFRKAIAGSAVFHLLLMALVLFVYRAEPKRIFHTPYAVSIVGPLKGAQSPGTTVPDRPETRPMPAQKQADKPQPPVRKAPPAPPQAPKEAVKIPEKAAPQADISEALKRVSESLKRRQESALVASSVEKLKEKQEKEKKELSKGVDEIRRGLSAKADVKKPAQQGPSGSNAPAAEAKYPAYYALIRDRVQDEWTNIEEVRIDRVSIIVSIKIARSGELLDTWLEKSSGNPRFDQSLLNAIKKAAPFPPLPQDFEGAYLETGIRFCPGCRN